MPFNFKNLLFNRPFTPRFRDVYYSSIPPIYPADNTPKKCITCLPCATDIYPPVGVLNTGDPGYGPGIYFGNTPQTFTATCPEGLGTPVTVDVAADIFFALTVDAANQIALQYATDKARSQLVCAVPVFNYCGSQEWPQESSGVPYSNSGNNTTGFIKHDGPDTLTSNGVVLSTGGIPFSADTFYTIPVVVTGDFTATFEIYPNGSFVPMDFYWAILDVALLRGANIGYQGNVFGGQKDSVFGTSCDYIAGLGGMIQIAIDGPQVNDLAWNTFTLKRVGTSMTTYINGVQGLTYDFQVLFGCRLGFTWATSSMVLRLRNISVTQP